MAKPARAKPARAKPPRQWAADILNALIERRDPQPIIDRIAVPADVELAKAHAGAWFDTVRFHARTYSKDRHYWPLIPTGMKPRVRAYLYQRANA